MASSSSFITLDKFNSVEYDGAHLWECQIEGAPSPFNNWFPAQQIDEPIRGVSMATMSFGLEEVYTFNSYSAVTLRMELIDNDNAVLETWLREWSKNLSYKESKGFYFSGFRYPEEIIRRLQITKYNWQLQPVYKREYLVVPTNDIQRTHQNDAALKTFNVNFAVFGSQEL